MTEEELQRRLGSGVPAQDERFVRGVMVRIEAESRGSPAIWVAAAVTLATFAAPYLASLVVPGAGVGLAIAAGVGAWAVAEASG